MKLTLEDLQELSTLCTRNESGRHFTETHAAEWLERMEQEGAIEIHRPVHGPTGIPYSQEYWSVEITEAAIADGEARNWGEE